MQLAQGPSKEGHILGLGLDKTFDQCNYVRGLGSLNSCTLLMIRCTLSQKTRTPNLSCSRIYIHRSLCQVGRPCLNNNCRKLKAPSPRWRRTCAKSGIQQGEVIGKGKLEVEGVVEEAVQAIGLKVIRAARSGRTCFHTPSCSIGLIDQVAIQVTREHAMRRIKALQRGGS